MKKIRYTLSPEEYRVLEKIARKTGVDCWFTIARAKDGTDCVYDTERKRRVTLRYGVKLLAEATEGFSSEELMETGITLRDQAVFNGLCLKLEVST